MKLEVFKLHQKHASPRLNPGRITESMKPFASMPTGVWFLTASLSMSPDRDNYSSRGRTANTAFVCERERVRLQVQRRSI